MNYLKGMFTRSQPKPIYYESDVNEDLSRLRPGAISIEDMPSEFNDWEESAQKEFLQRRHDRAHLTPRAFAAKWGAPEPSMKIPSPMRRHIERGSVGPLEEGINRLSRMHGLLNPSFEHHYVQHERFPHVTSMRPGPAPYRYTRRTPPILPKPPSPVRPTRTPLEPAAMSEFHRVVRPPFTAPASAPVERLPDDPGWAEFERRTLGYYPDPVMPVVNLRPPPIITGPRQSRKRTRSRSADSQRKRGTRRSP